MRAKRRILLAVMVAVTAWSVWAFAQGRRPTAGFAPAPQETAEPPVLAQPQVQAGERAEENAAETESETPKPFNWWQFGGETPPYIAMLVNFAIMAGGYYLLGRKPIAAGLQSRRDRIASEIEQAQRMHAEAEERAKIYQAKLDALEHEVKIAREALVRAGEAERDRIVREAEAKAERMQKDAEFLVEQELKQIRQDLWRETVDVAIQAAQQLLEKRVTAADQERLAEDYLADLALRGRTRKESVRPPPPVTGEAT